MADDNEFAQFADQSPSDDTNPFAQFAPQTEDNPFAQFAPKSSQPESSFLGAFGRGVAEQQVPTLGGLAGAGAGAAIGTAVLPGAGTVVGAIAGGLGGAYLGAKGQDAALDQLGLKGPNGPLSDEQLQADREQHPWARRAADVVSTAEAFAGGPASGAARLASAGINAGIEGGQQIVSGHFDPTDIALKAATGYVLPNTRQWADKVFGVGSAVGEKLAKGVAGRTAPTSSLGTSESPAPPPMEGDVSSNPPQRSERQYPKDEAASEASPGVTQGDMAPDTTAALASDAKPVAQPEPQQAAPQQPQPQSAWESAFSPKTAEAPAEVKPRPLSSDVPNEGNDIPQSNYSPPPRLLDMAQNAIDKGFEIGSDLQMKLTPMAAGSDTARATLKDYANAMRMNRYEWSRIDGEIEKKFTPEQRERMWNAGNEESELRQQGESSEHMGTATLTAEERSAVEELQSRANVTFLKARDLGMVEGEGLPSYVPRMVVNIAEGGEGPRSLSSLNPNVRTSTGQLRQRKYLTAEETESAAKAKFGEQAEIARDIRALPLATAKLEDAIAGRTLVNKIKEIGKAAGEDTVVEGAKPTDGKWFTIDDSPAFQTWRPKLKEVDGKLTPYKDPEGNVVFEKIPLYVRGDFEGPIRAVLTSDSGKAYTALMALKGKTMGLIMNSPAIHNLVEYGRAFFAMPGKMLPLSGTNVSESPNFGWLAPAVYRDGARAVSDVGTMKEAISHGLVPIGHRAYNQDISSIMEAPSLKPGRSWTAQLVGYIPGLFDPKAGDSVKRAIDKAGDFWHNKLLWDVVGRLQMGLYVNFRERMIADGISPQTAQYTAAHWANRFAGALPKEAMSNSAQKAANVLLFSRSFTIGNLGVMKDAITGLPRDVLAQIERDVGPLDPGAKQFTRNMAARKAFAVIAADIAFFYIGNSVLQSAMNVILGERDAPSELKAYATRAAGAATDIANNPSGILQPFKILEKLSSTSENEPGKQDRIKVGYAKDGTAIYARSPMGKIGEEFLGWMSWPLDMLRRKEGTIARPATQIFANDQGFGRKVYNPNADTVGEYIKNAALIAWQIVKSQGPEGQLSAAKDLIKGEGDTKTNTLQTLGPILGVTFSKGAPGGPAVGEMYNAKQKYEYAVQQALPAIRRQIQNGDTAGAIERMGELGIPRGLQRFYIQTAQNPSTRLSGRSVRDFYNYSNQDQRDRFEAALRRSQNQ